MSAWAGDLSDLGQLADNLSELASVPSRSSRDAASKIGRMIDREFATGTDPDGEPWADLAESTIEKKDGDDRILIDSGDMRRGMSVRPMARAGIAVTSDADYLGFHQGDGSPGARVPPRHVLPEGDLPSSWERAISDAIDAAAKRALR